MTDITKRIGPNTSGGRDFVVGDVHGCFRTLDQLLDQVPFVAGKDRLFSVGDLVDRGPHSHEGIEWLIDGRIASATMGNHENGLVGFLLNGAVADGAEPWWHEIDPADRGLWIAVLRTMPLALTIETPHGDVGVIHAGPVGRSWTATLEALERHDREAMRTALLGGREAYRALWAKRPADPITGARAIVTGHYVRGEVRSDGGWWRIDTGAGFGHGRLTLLRIDCEPMVATTVDVVAPEQESIDGEEPTRGRHG